MNSKAPYLDAIQRIPGKTAKEKYESLNKIIKQITESKKTPGDFEAQTMYGSPIPAVLEPLIETEVAKILKKPEDVLTALKSDDAVVINRGLQADWIFDGSNKSITNFQYFATNVFPEISLSTRTNVIKRLSQHLGHRKEYEIAQQFFEGISKLYNIKQAMPLLSACSEDYLSEIIKNKNVNLPKKVVTRLFSKYPELVIRYFKFGSPASCKERVVNVANITNYVDTLPKLIKKYPYDFVDIVDSCYYNLDITLGKKCTALFLESKAVEALISKPKKFLKFFPLELVTKKLSKEQFKHMFRNLFPEEDEYFFFDEMCEYLKFQPKNTRLTLILDTFKDVYGKDLLTMLDKVTVQMLLMLPSEDRVKIARQKMKAEPQKVLDWICYLPLSESIPQIKKEISISNIIHQRCSLIGQLIYTCRVNNSEDDLRDVLQYISTRHRNEMSCFWYDVFNYLMRYFKLESLSENHWNSINEIIQRCHIKGILPGRPDISEKILEKSVHFNLLNSIPIEDKMTLLAELKITGWNSSFNILSDFPNYEKVCLETFIDIIPRKFPEDNPIWEDNDLDTIKYLVRGIYDYNERIQKAAKKKQKIIQSNELLSITKYPWLLEKVKNTVLLDDSSYQNKVEEIKKLLSIHERKLYDSWIPPTEKLAKVYKQEGLNLLKKEPSKILEHWEEYLKSCKKNLESVYTRKFLKKCTWYSEIPMKFLEETLNEFNESDGVANEQTIMILALLLRGPEFAQLVEPLVPVSEKMDIDGEDAKDLYNQAHSIPPAINEVNPPPSLELVAKFCQGDFLHLGLTSLMNIVRRMPVNRVIAFGQMLSEKPVSVQKHGIRVLCMVSTSEYLSQFLKHLWDTQNHQSIKTIVFEKTFQLFCSQACDNSWQLLKHEIESLTLEYPNCFKTLYNIHEIPNEYVLIYFETCLNKLEVLERDGISKNEELIDSSISYFLQAVDDNICALFSEDYCQHLLRNYVFDLNRAKMILSGGYNFATYKFLLNAGNKIDSRLTAFCNLLKSTIDEKWNQPDPKNFRFYPARKLFSKFVSGFAFSEIQTVDMKILKALEDIFSSKLQPHQDFESYLKLYFGIKLKQSGYDGVAFGSIIGEKLPDLLKIFMPEMMIEIGQEFTEFLLGLEYSLFDKKTQKVKEFIFPVTQSLIDNGSIYSCILAAIIISKKHTKFPDHLYKEIVRKLQKVNHPTVIALINKHIDSVKLDEVYRE